MGYKLLLADDSITIQKVVSIIFANEECELTIVDNGNAALEKAGEVLPDIMLVDTLMPGTSGYEVCERIRQNPSLKAIPLLLLTGAFEPFDVEKAKESGADDFISKPFESQLLVDKVKSLVELGKGRKGLAPPPEPAVATVIEPEEEAVSEPVAPVEDHSVWTIDASASTSPAETYFSEEAFSSQPETAAIPAEENVWAIDVPAADLVPELSVEEAVQAEEPAEWAPPVYEIEETAWTIGASPADAAQGLLPVDEPLSVDTVSEEDFPAIEEVVDQVTEEVVEVSSDDDLWGAFELEPLVDDGRHDDVVETYMVEPTAASFSVSPALEEPYATPADSALGFPEIRPGWGEAEEEASSTAEPVAVSDALEDIRPEPVSPTEAIEIEADSPFAESFFFTEPPAPAASATEDLLLESQVSSWREPLQAAPVEMAAPVEASAAHERDVAPALAAVALTEEQLQTMVSKISREVIERIVWEVVPDLAEVLIKEEIRKIKEGR